MKILADENDQLRVLTFLFNFIVSDKPLEIRASASKRRREQQLAECSNEGYHLIKTLLGIENVWKINISMYEVEVVFSKHYNSEIRRQTVRAIMEAAGGTLHEKPEYVIVTTDASRDVEVVPEIDPSMYDN